MLDPLWTNQMSFPKCRTFSYYPYPWIIYDFHIVFTSDSTCFWSRIGTRKMHHRLRQNCVALWLYFQELFFFTRQRIWVVAHQRNHPCWLTHQTHNEFRFHSTIHGLSPHFKVCQGEYPHLHLSVFRTPSVHVYASLSETLNCPNPGPTTEMHLQEQVEWNSCFWCSEM